ncbi:gamma-tubulin complex component 5-like [Tubulanus polymorphus]|uniref:gamma-tubulin complex component 5-like n=1 Tax=Tubulanus polymorphus TaxID=672921 RepID=UPI003DA3939A
MDLDDGSELAILARCRVSTNTVMAALRPEFERSVKKLIRNITGFRDRDENFQICLNFVLSNFKYHRFLEVDSHKVRRNLDGVHEKFQIYSQHEKAFEYKRLVQLFLSTPAFAENKPQTDTHYALLQILLSLAETPTLVDYHPPIVDKPLDEVDEFDWKAYLLEGEDTTRLIYPDTSSDEEDWRLDDDDNDDAAAVVSTAIPFDSGVRVETDRDDDDDDEEEEMTLTGAEFTTKSHYDWLTRNVVVQYWKSDNALSISSPRVNGISDIWEKYLFDSNPLYVLAKRHLLTETQIIRETLWMLFGAGDRGLFVYDFTDSGNELGGRFTVSDELKVSHLTTQALVSVLESFCHYGNIVHKLETFVTVTTELSVSSAGGTCQTYQAFAKSIARFLNRFKSELVKLEEETIEQEGTLTIATMLSRLSASFDQLALIGEIYDECLTDRLHDGCHSEADGMRSKAYRLISRLYAVLMTVSLYSTENMKKFRLLMLIWLDTIRPYLNIIGEWLTSGRLNDVYGEFVIRRNESVKNDDADFWRKSFVLHCEEPQDEQTHFFDEDRRLPSFLQPVLRELLLCGKSMEVLNSLGKLQKVIPGREHRFKLYEKFIENLLKLSEQQTVNKTAVVDHNRGNRSIITRSDHQYDALLGINFGDIFNGERFLVDDYNEEEQRLQGKIDGLTSANSRRPFYRLMSQCLYPFIRDRYRLISEQFLSILKNEYNLKQHLSTMKAFYLMEAGDTMYDFYTALFDKLRHGEDCKDSPLLNGLLEDALYARFPEHKSRMFVEVVDVPATTKTQQPINALNCLKLHYKLPWAISLVVNTDAQEIYGQILTELLQIKRAKFSLDSLHHSDLSRDSDEEKQTAVDETFLSLYQTEDAYRFSVKHRMLLLRQKLLHFVNSFHNYIMTRILHSSGLEFEAEFVKCGDFDQVIEAHSKYIVKLQEQCLLTKPLAVLKEAVNRVFNLALRFAAMWDEGHVATSMSDLIVIETDLSRCINFLSVFLNNIIKRGSTPHLETLAFYLSTAENLKPQ